MVIYKDSSQMSSGSGVRTYSEKLQLNVSENLDKLFTLFQHNTDWCDLIKFKQSHHLLIKSLDNALENTYPLSVLAKLVSVVDVNGRTKPWMFCNGTLSRLRLNHMGAYVLDPSEVKSY